MLENVLQIRRPKAPNGQSKYIPHQGEREKLRRRLGGFHRHRRNLALVAKHGDKQ